MNNAPHKKIAPNCKKPTIVVETIINAANDDPKAEMNVINGKRARVDKI